MRKWLLLLACALLINAAGARAEETYFTSNHDPYYHADSACDTPPETTWSGEMRAYYPRKAYNKVVISSEAASAFEKMPCPVCCGDFAPVYLGDHFPEWPLECDPWGIGDIDPEMKMTLMKKRPQSYVDEISATDQAFDGYFSEYFDHETQQMRMQNAYPAWYGDRWSNNAAGKTYALVSPTQEVLDEFKSLFGSGAWIVPAKYSWNELTKTQDEIFSATRKWCDDHPEAGAQAVSAYSSTLDGGVFIGVYGTGWQNAAAAMDEIAPIYVHFYQEASLPETTGF